MALQYPKRPGTSGIRGQLYETKLLSLIYFRAIHDDRIEEFHLATNVDEIGSFDDICFRAKVRGNDKPLTVFIQAKHKENKNSVLTLNKSDLAEYCNSYLKIRRKFEPTNEHDKRKDVLFNGQLSETDCLFVIYTNAKGDKKSRTYQGSYAEHLNALIKTGDPGSQPSHENKDVELLCEIVLEEQMTALARQMVKCIFGEFNDIQMVMLDKLVLQYHVILGQKVFDISEIQPEGHRNARFRDDFFYINEEFLRLFKDELCTEILKRRSSNDLLKIYRISLDSHIVLRKIVDVETLHKELGSRFIYKNGKLVFHDKNIPDRYKRFLDKINEEQENIRKTVEMALKECLPTQTFKVPASFGNKDLAITRKGDIKIERKLNDLTNKIVKFIDKSKHSNVIIIDDSFGEGFLQLSGGIASAVGNLFIFDESSKLLKFNDNCESLGNLAKKLYDKLKEKIDNLYEYKFDVKAETFPKLSFATDECNKKVVSDFLSTLLFYTSQHNEEDVEETLIYEITNSQGDDVQHVEVTSNAIFLKYHDEIQKWSMPSEVEMGTYLEKPGSLYEKAVKHTARWPLIRVINMMQSIKNKNYTFNDSAVNSIKFDDLPSGTVIVTENTALTVAKLTNDLDNKDCIVLDLEYILNLSGRDDKTLRRELTNTKEVKTVIVVVNKEIIIKSSSKKLENIANSIKDKIVIIITDQNSVENAKKYFSATDNVINDEIKLIDMSEESRNNILRNTKVIFQGNEVSLGKILINDTIGYVVGDVLYKLMNSNKKNIGKPISNSNYNPKLYFPRRVRCIELKTPDNMHDVLRKRRIKIEKGSYNIQTFNDFLHEDVVIIIGDPGMGKSTLLTHLSLKTIEIWTKLGWILRINLLEYSQEFSEWKKNKTDIDTLESLKFLCKVALSEDSSKTSNLNITLEESNGTVYLKDCTGDEWTVFELKILLSFFSTQELIILLDGFDEICPTYVNEVMALIKAVKKFPQNHKMWITSRSFEKMDSILELQCVTLYEIEPLNTHEQDSYLNSIWEEKEILKDLNDDHFKNIYEFIMFMSQGVKKSELPIESNKEIPFLRVFVSLIKYLKYNLTFAPSIVKNALNELFDERYGNSVFQNQSVAIPLHLNIIADYLYNKIKEINLEPKNWDMATNIFNVYEYFMVTKLKKIRLQEKNQNDMSKPDNISAYEREYADFKDKHKKLAAYAVFGKCLFNENETKQFEEIIIKLKEGEERTGIICDVVNGVPIFVHSSFGEYFAVDYICDLLKSNENQKSIWDFILNVMFINCSSNVLATLDAKIKIDKKLLSLFEKNKTLIFDLLLKQGESTKNKYGRIESSLCEAIRNDLRNMGFLLLSTVDDNLDENNLVDFIKIVNETDMFFLAIIMEFEPELIKSLVYHIKLIDATKLIMIFKGLDHFVDVQTVSNEELWFAIMFWAFMKYSTG